MLPLVVLPKQTLREPSRAVTRAELLTTEMQDFIKEMIPAMYHYGGVGLAAPQVDKNVRICLINKEADKSLRQDLILVNPQLEILSKKNNVDSEGCLSVPNTFGKIKRHNHIQVKAWDSAGNELAFTAKNFCARVIQHELDHLNGRLFIDRAQDIYEITAEEKLKRIQEMRE